MGKKKIPFIDKKRSTTYTLTYGGGDAEAADDDGASQYRGGASEASFDYFG